MSRRLRNPRPDAEPVGAAARRVFLLCCQCEYFLHRTASHPSSHCIALYRMSPRTGLLHRMAFHRIALRTFIAIPSHPIASHCTSISMHVQFNSISMQLHPPYIPPPGPRLMPPTSACCACCACCASCFGPGHRPSHPRPPTGPSQEHPRPAQDPP